MEKYIRAEYFDKNGETCFKNIYIANKKKLSWHEIFRVIENRLFKGTGNILIGFMNFRDITDWKKFDSMTDDDIRVWIDRKKVDFIFYLPKIFVIPDDAEVIGMDEYLYILKQ